MLSLYITEESEPLALVEVACQPIAFDVAPEYAVCVYDARDDLVAMSRLSWWRWSAPVQDLLLRGLCLALYDQEAIPPRASNGPRIDKGVLATLYICPPERPQRLLGRWFVARRGPETAVVTIDATAQPGNLSRRYPVRFGSTLWPLLLRAWCWDLFGCAEVGPRPPRLHVPTYLTPYGCQYIKAQDLPPYLQKPFGSTMLHAARPSGVEGDAYYADALAWYLGYVPSSEPASD